MNSLDTSHCRINSDCAIPLRAWALRVGAGWLDDAIAEVDFSANEVVGVSGSRYDYDVVSLNLGSQNALGNVADDMRDRVLAVKPCSDFVRLWLRLRRRNARRGSRHKSGALPT